MDSDSLQPGIPPEDPRVRLAGERTLLAWVRTALAMMGFGFVVARFGLFLREMEAVNHVTTHHGLGWSLWIGTGLILLGVTVVVLAAGEHRHFLRRIDEGLMYQPPKRSLGIIVALILAALGVAMTAYLFAVGW